MNRLIEKLRVFVTRTERGRTFDEQRYWERRYAANGSSGDGSYGRLAEFKASVLNELIGTRHIRTAVEFGCGDGNQLSLVRYPRYIGLDISPSVIALCRKKFEADESKTFALYEPHDFDADPRFVSDLAVSLDVIYHIVSDAAYQSYMTHLCDTGTKCIAIYSTNIDRVEAVHIRHREFSRWIAENRPELALESVIENPYPGEGVQESNASFYIYGRPPKNRALLDG